MTETDDLRRQLTEATNLLAARGRAVDLAERRLADARADSRSLAQQNAKLNDTLREARDSLVALREQVERLGQPPHAFGTVIGLVGDGLVDVSVNGRWLRVSLSPEVSEETLSLGIGVLLNEAMIVIAGTEHRPVGEVVRLREELPSGELLVAGSNDDEVVMQRGSSLRRVDLAAGDSLIADRRALVVLEHVNRTNVEELVLDETPDVCYADIGGLADQIDLIRDAVELPFLHADLFAEFRLAAPKGVLLYGPPGCGKTMIAKAVANSLSEQVGSGSYFLNIKGPELLNKYVGETERQIRLIFARAREHATDGRPVIIFFDEMDSLFRTRGSGVSSDVESTIVPQLLSEIDGVEGLQNVIIIGASNREDLIDPAILRPGRLDVKIKLDRPREQGASEIFTKYLTPGIPLNASEQRRAGGAEAFRAGLIDEAVEALFATTEANRFIEVTYAGGDKETMYVRDFVSGAMIANIIGRAKKAAIKEVLGGGAKGLRRRHVQQACLDEIAENEDLPNTTNPDDWARISGKKGERITFIRTLIGSRALTPTD